MKNALFLLISYFVFFAPLSASAAVKVFLDPAEVAVNARDTFSLNVRIDTDGECVNAIDGQVHFDPKALNAIDFGRGQSLISLWVSPPSINRDTGIVSFSGGIPGGYCGRVSGDPGVTNVLGKIVFSPVKDVAIPLSTRLDFERTSTVLLADGFGTPADAEFRGADVTIGEGESANNEWLSEIRSDTIAPEYFTIALDREPNAYNGKYFIAWNTTDKQSGIDHYEVLETNPWKFGFRNMFGSEKQVFWIQTESPYVLQDQNLRSKIYVKAVDKIGNERIAEFAPVTSLLRRVEIDRMWLLITALLSLLAFGVAAWRIKRAKKQNNVGTV